MTKSATSAAAHARDSGEALAVVFWVISSLEY